MTQSAAVHNPFMLLLNPEIVLAAIEKSERLSQLNRHLCRPLDKPSPTNAVPVADADADAEVGANQEDGADRNLSA